MALKQRNDPYYFLFAICFAMLVYYLFSNFASVPAVVSENAPLHDQFQVEENSENLNVTGEKEFKNSIRKIADVNTLGDQSIFPIKPKGRKPADQNTPPGNETR